MMAFEMLLYIVVACQVIEAGIWGLAYCIYRGGALAVCICVQMTVFVVTVVYSVSSGIDLLALALWFLVGLSGLSFVCIGLWQVHRDLKPVAFVLRSGLILLTVLSLATALFPSSSFYVNEFEASTGYVFSERVEVLQKSATFADFHGDYSSEAIFKLSENEYSSLVRVLTPDNKRYGCVKKASLFGVQRSAQGCWLKQIAIDRRVVVFYLPAESSIYYLYTQT